MQDLIEEMSKITDVSMVATLARQLDQEVVDFTNKLADRTLELEKVISKLEELRWSHNFVRPTFYGSGLEGDLKLAKDFLQNLRDVKVATGPQVILTLVERPRSHLVIMIALMLRTLETDELAYGNIPVQVFQAPAILDILPRWIEEFSYQPHSSEEARYLLEKIGSRKLLNILHDCFDSVPPDIPIRYSRFILALLSFMLCNENTYLVSPDEKSLWLKLACRSGGSATLSQIKCADPADGDSDDSTGRALQRLLVAVSPQGDLDAVIQAAMAHVTVTKWNQSLADSVLQSLEQGSVLGHVLSSELYITCLTVAQRSMVLGSAAAFIKYLASPHTRAAFKAAQQESAVGTALDYAISARLPSTDISVVRASLGMLSLSSDYGVQLCPQSYEAVLRAGAGIKDRELCLFSLEMLLKNSSSPPSDGILPSLFVIPGMRPMDLLELRCKCVDKQSASCFINALTMASAQEEGFSSSWALDIVSHAILNGVEWQPRSVSALIESFLKCRDGRETRLWTNDYASDGEYSDGVRAALMAFKSLIAGPRGLLLISDLSAPAKELMADVLIQSSDPDLEPLRPLILDLRPSEQLARQLLGIAVTTAKPLSSASFRSLLLMATERGWRGLGDLALTALAELDSQDQADVLSSGGGAVLGSLILTDMKEQQSAGVVTSSLSPLLRLSSLMQSIRANWSWIEWQHIATQVCASISHVVIKRYLS